MRVAIGCDHRGYDVKDNIVDLIERLGHEVFDAGTNDRESVDYPDFAEIVAQRVATRKADRGILICGTGIGMAIAANKVEGVRAATCHDDLTAEMSRRHNDTNVLCLAADLLADPLINHMVDTWLKTDFEGGRHARRIDKITRLEGENERPTS